MSIGKVDAVFNDKNIANYYIKKYGFRDIRVSNNVNEKNEGELDKYYFATLKEQSILISILNKAYANLNITTLQKIQEKWFGSYNSSTTLTKEEEYYLFEKKVKMCIVDNFEPLSKVKNNRPENFISDLINEIKLESNISFEYIFTQNFEESYKLLNENKCEVIPFVENSYNKLDKYSFTKPYLSLSMVAIGKKDKEFFSDLSELKNKKISILSTLNISDELKIKYPNLKIVKVKDSNEALELLKSNQVYAHLTFYPIAKDIVLKNNGDNLKIIGRLVKTVDISMLTKKENEILNSILDKLLLNISPTKINALINKWSDVKIKKVIDYGFIFKLLILFFLILIFGYWRYRIIKNSKEEFEAIFKFSKDGIVIGHL